MERPSASKIMQQTLDQAREKMNKAIETLQSHLAQIRT